MWRLWVGRGASGRAEAAGGGEHLKWGGPGFAGAVTQAFQLGAHGGIAGGARTQALEPAAGLAAHWFEAAGAPPSLRQQPAPATPQEQRQPGKTSGRGQEKRRPEDFAKVNWIFCDIIAYPEKTVEMIMKWVSHAQQNGKKISFVCTLKFQGKTNFAAIEKAQGFSGSHIVHLHNNKHELTWYFL